MRRKYSDSQWQEDIHFMVTAMKRIHPNLFHDITEHTFQCEIDQLTSSVPHLTDNEIITALLKLAALTKDWHTQIISNNLSELWYPIRVERMEDGLFITAASPEYTQCLGARLLRIGKCSAKDAFTKLKCVTAHDNPCSQRYFASMFFSIPSVLNGLHINDSLEALRLEISPLAGEPREVCISANPYDSDDNLSWYWQKEAAPTKESVKITTHVKHLPLYWKNSDRYYWFEFLERYKAIYLSFNMTLNDNGESFADFISRLWEYTDHQDVVRLIIDLRHNLGGDHDILQPLIKGILHSEQINRHDHLFVIIGPKNVSASSHCVAWLEKEAQPTLVGEPTGARPNQYADPEHMRLPNSQLRLMVSKIFWKYAPTEDDRQWIQPHVMAGFRSTDYFNLIDPAMDKVIGLFENG